MKIADRYILKKYLSTFVFCLLLFTVIAVVIDISEKTDDFSKASLTFVKIVRDYYFGFIPRIDALLFPLFVFISVIFFTSKMAGRSEVIAILSSGVAFRRFLMPFLGGALILGGFLWAGYRYVIPRANRTWADFHKAYLDSNEPQDPNKANKKGSIKTGMYFRLDKDRYIGIKSYDTTSKTGNSFFLQQFKDNKLIYNLRASNFNWDTVHQKWKLFNVTERSFHDINETVTHSQQKTVAYNLRPIDLRNDDYLKDQLSTPDLTEFIEREKIRGSENLNSLLFEKNNRDAIPASVVILTIIGVSLASRKVRGGSGAHIALGVVLSMVYILFSRFSVVFATQGNFTPWLASWTPNILFGILAFFLYRRAAR